MTRRDEQIRLILEEIERGTATSHRCISARVGLSLGLTNQLLRYLLRRRFVRVSRIDTTRRQYLLTALGAREQARVAREHLQMAVGHYADVRDGIRRRFAELAREWPGRGTEKRIVLYGNGDLAEIAYTCAQRTGLRVVGVVDDTQSAPEDAGPASNVVQLSDFSAESFDGVVVVTCDASTSIRSRLETLGVPAARVLWL